MTGHVVFAADQRYARWVAVAARALVDAASDPGKLHIHVLSHGFGASERALVEQNLLRDAPPRALSIHDFDVGRVQHLLRSRHVSHMSYARLFIAEFLPPDAQRAAYVDTDVVFRRDALEFLNIPLAGNIIGAVPNGDRADADAQFSRLGISSPGRYFNAGVMTIDVPKWRAEDICSRALDFARHFRGELALWDQDMLNAVLVDRWLPVAEHWNAWASRPEPEELAVLHFSMSVKPWHADYEGPHSDVFFDALDRTSLRGWRPWSGGGVGAVLRRAWRLLPYPPTVLRYAGKGLRTIASSLGFEDSGDSKQVK